MNATLAFSFPPNPTHRSHYVRLTSFRSSLSTTESSAFSASDSVGSAGSNKGSAWFSGASLGSRRRLASRGASSK